MGYSEFATPWLGPLGLRLDSKLVGQILPLTRQFEPATEPRMNMTTPENFESEAAAWEEASRATRVAEMNTEDPAQAARAARVAASAWTAAAEATEGASAQ